jgi:hypothetical protein
MTFNALRSRPPSACRFHPEKSLLFATIKTEWTIFHEAIVCWSPFMSGSGRMWNDKPGEVKRVAPSEFRRRAQVVAAQPVNDSMDRPRLVSDRFRLQSDRRRIEHDDVILETFTLPLEAARRKVRDIINDISQRGYREIVERWRQLPNGQIEFTMRRLPVSD